MLGNYRFGVSWRSFGGLLKIIRVFWRFWGYLEWSEVVHESVWLVSLWTWGFMDVLFGVWRRSLDIISGLLEVLGCLDSSEFGP